MKKSSFLGIALYSNTLFILIFNLVFLKNAFAAPVGIEYFLLLDIPAVSYETHDGYVTFDGVAETLPSTSTIGQDLFVTESISMVSSVTDRVSIVFTSSTPGATLTVFPINTNSDVEIDINGLYWDNQPTTLSNFQLDVTYAGGGVASFPLILDPWDIFGDGTADSPFAIGPIVDSSFFSDISHNDAIEVTFSFDATHVPVPPALYFFGTGLLGLIGVARRKAV